MTNQGKSLAREETPVNGTERPPCDWNSIDWSKASKVVRHLRHRIFRATQEGNFKTVRSLQKLLLRSYSNRVVSVRRVAQENVGSRTAGVDRILLKSSQSRGMVVDQLATLTPWKALPARRVYIPKANGKLRPLGIPTIRDRAVQAIVKNALEPSWEARFEASSYGFRPGRGCHDAIARIFNVASSRTTRCWVLDADIKGAFDNISHDFLLKAIDRVPGRELIKQWLKAGYMELGAFHPTEAGTPQGGVISPLLANIALHGMEEAIGFRRRQWNCSAVGGIVGDRVVIRYADDFVVFCKSRESAEEVQKILTTWLAKRGLSFSEEKTRIVHLTEGFDFLGFNIRHYETPPCKRGVKLLIRISAKSMQKERDKMREAWRRMQSYSPQEICRKLNPMIKGWASYFRIGVSSKQFESLDNFMWQRQMSYIKRRHPHKSHDWRNRRYFGMLHPHRTDRWVFGDVGKSGGSYLNKYAWTRIKRHILVKNTSSPDDPSLKSYWEVRHQRKIADLPLKQRRLAERQDEKCPRCGEPLVNGEIVTLGQTTAEELHKHHRLPRREGGSDELENLELLHLFCHQQAEADYLQLEKEKSGRD